MTDIPITRTKILQPRRPADLLTRQRLLELLFDLLDYRLIIIAAPAGYGKTSLLIDFAHQVDLPVCWYALDELDRDPQRFIAHFIASLAERFPSFGKGAAAALQGFTSTDLDIDRLVTTLVNEVYAQIREYFVLILDDFHLVDQSETINAIVNRFVQDVDENCHLILSSRSLLTMHDLPLMVARSQVGGLGFDELVFHAGEIQALVRQNYHSTMPASVAEDLARETEGWVTGLLLSAQTMWQGMVDRVRVARVSGVGLYDYLAQQVLDHQPAPIRRFLLRTSLLEEFDAELCAAVLESDQDCQNLMEAVLQRNLFVVPVDDHGTWLRYHHLFRDFLQSRMAQESPDEQDRLLRRLASVYSDRGEWEKAHSVYQRLGDGSAIAELVEKAGPHLAKGGRLLTVAEWLDALPGEMVESRPALLSLRGIVTAMLGDVESGLALLNRAVERFRAAGDRIGLASTLVRRATAYRFQGDYQACLADADETLALADGGGGLKAVRSEALRSKGLSLLSLGLMTEAIEWFERALAAYTALDDEQNMALVRTEMGMAYRRLGRYDQALACFDGALAYWSQAQNAVDRATFLNNLGVLYHIKGEYERADALFNEAVDCARRGGYLRLEGVVLTSIGDLYADLDAPEAALDAYSQARDRARRTADHFLQVYLNLAESGLALSQGEIPQARRLLEAAQTLLEGSGSNGQQSFWQFLTGRLDLAQGETAEAVFHLERAARGFQDGGQRMEAAQSHMYLAVAHYGGGDEQAALSHLKSTFRLIPELTGIQAVVVPGREAKALLEVAQRDPVIGTWAARLLQEVLQFEEDIPALRRRLRRRQKTVQFEPPNLIIQALGAARVEADGQPVADPEWQSRREVRELFFLFLAYPDGLSKDALGEILWPGSSPRQLKVRFKNGIYRLRRALGQDVILLDENRYRFNETLDYEYDVEIFLERLAQADDAANPAERAGAYQAALKLYKGPYLPEVEGTWAWPERYRLEQAYLKAILALAEHHLNTAEYEAALAYCQQALAVDSCLEQAHRLAMRTHAAMGNRAAVARQFERCRDALATEVGAPPTAQTESLYATLMR